MIELTNPELRARDIRKLVEPGLDKVSWDVRGKQGQSLNVFDVFDVFYTVNEFFSVYFEKGRKFPCLPFGRIRSIGVSYAR